MARKSLAAPADPPLAAAAQAAAPAAAPAASGPAALPPAQAEQPTAKSPSAKRARPAARKASPASAKPGPAKPVKSVKLPKPKPKPEPAAKPVAVAKPAGRLPRPHPKLVRDSFTMPEADFAYIARLKVTALGVGRAAKKSELLRAGLRMLATLDARALVQVLDDLTPVKTGRPKKGR